MKNVPRIKNYYEQTVARLNLGQFRHYFCMAAQTVEQLCDTFSFCHEVLNERSAIPFEKADIRYLSFFKVTSSMSRLERRLVSESPLQLLLFEYCQRR